MKFSIAGLLMPTPEQIEKASNAILMGSIFIATLTVMTNHDFLALIWAHLGAAAKMLSIFFSEDKSNADPGKS